MVSYSDFPEGCDMHQERLFKLLFTASCLSGHVFRFTEVIFGSLEGMSGSMIGSLR